MYLLLQFTIHVLEYNMFLFKMCIKYSEGKERIKRIELRSNKSVVFFNY